MVALTTLAIRKVTTKENAPTAPTLKPNQPNQSMPAPSSVSGSECGGMGSFGQWRRRPTTSASATPAMPALRCTTVPPAKSSAPSLNSQPVGENTQWATGAYTKIAQSVIAATKPPNLSRSAVEPVISAGVMIANMSWKLTKTSGGMLWASGPV